MSDTSEFIETEHGAIWLHPFTSHQVLIVTSLPPSLSRECFVVSPLSGSVLTVYLSFYVSHRWVLSCVSNLWLSESPALHFLLLPWLGTRERGSGLIRYLQIGAQANTNLLYLYISRCVHFTVLSVIFGSMHSHKIVQLQSGVWRGVDEDIRQSIPLVCHPIWHRKKRGELGRK